MLIGKDRQMGGKNWINEKERMRKKNSLSPFLASKGNLCVILEMSEHCHAIIKKKIFTLFYWWGSNQTC